MLSKEDTHAFLKNCTQDAQHAFNKLPVFVNRSETQQIK